MIPSTPAPTSRGSGPAGRARPGNVAVTFEAVRGGDVGVHAGDDRRRSPSIVRAGSDRRDRAARITAARGRPARCPPTCGSSGEPGRRADLPSTSPGQSSRRRRRVAAAASRSPYASASTATGTTSITGSVWPRTAGARSTGCWAATTRGRGLRSSGSTTPSTPTASTRSRCRPALIGAGRPAASPADRRRRRAVPGRTTSPAPRPTRTTPTSRPPAWRRSPRSTTSRSSPLPDAGDARRRGRPASRPPRPADPPRRAAAATGSRSSTAPRARR